MARSAIGFAAVVADRLLAREMDPASGAGASAIRREGRGGTADLDARQGPPAPARGQLRDRMAGRAPWLETGSQLQSDHGSRPSSLADAHQPPCRARPLAGSYRKPRSPAAVTEPDVAWSTRNRPIS